AIAFGGSRLGTADVSAMLGTVDQGQVFHLLDAIARRDAAALLDQVAQFSEFSPDYSHALDSMASALHRVAVEQTVPGAQDNSQGDHAEILRLAGQLVAEDVQLFYQIAIQGRRDLALAPDPRTGFEMTLLRMLAFIPNAQSAPEQIELASSGSATRSTPAVVGATAGESIDSNGLLEPAVAAALATGAERLDSTPAVTSASTPVADEVPVALDTRAPSLESTEPEAQEPAAVEAGQLTEPSSGRAADNSGIALNDRTAVSLDESSQNTAEHPEPDDVTWVTDETPGAQKKTVKMEEAPPLDAYSDEEIDGADETAELGEYFMDAFVDSMVDTASQSAQDATTDPENGMMEDDEGAIPQRPPSEQGPLLTVPASEGVSPQNESWVAFLPRL